MPKRKPARKKPSAKTTHTHIMGASGAGKGDFLSATLEELHDTGKPFGILDPHGDSLPKPPKPKTKKG